MSKWKIFGGSTQNKDELDSIEPSTSNVQSKDNNLSEYSETLQTTSIKKGKKSKTNSDQRYWRDIKSIEESIDNLHIRRGQKHVTSLDVKVEKILKKHKKK